jgi:amino acid transporter
MQQNEIGQLPNTFWQKLRRTVFGAPRNLKDPSLSHKISLIAFLAWVGLGADGLSSSSYGPEEAFRALMGVNVGGRIVDYPQFAILLALATALTVFIISYAYSRIIEHFPHGGGGYVVATELLGNTAGVVSGCALLVDYILTITVSIASGADAVFSLVPVAYHTWKLPVEFGAIALLTVMNMRGVKESVSMLVPVFLTFVVTHIILIGGGLLMHVGDAPVVIQQTRAGWRDAWLALGGWKLFLLVTRSYSMGAGTYTGIEAVSNGLGIMRDPKVQTGKRTMTYMAVSLALTAGGLFLCYALFNVKPVEGQTLNNVLANAFAGNWRVAGLPVGKWFAAITILSEAVLLLVAAQTGFIDGPRVMANMALDSWLPRRFAALSDRLTTQNGVLLIGAAAAAALAYTRGKIALLVIMYSINVFLTFSLSQLGMLRFWTQRRRTERLWLKHFFVHGIGFLLCAAILAVMLVEKLTEGGWITLAVTGLCIGICFLVRAHYRDISRRVHDVESTFDNIPLGDTPHVVPEFDPKKPTAVILVGGSAKLGTHCLLNIFRMFPKTFHNVVFISVGVMNSEFFKGEHQVEALEKRTSDQLAGYVKVATQLGIPARSAYRIGLDVVEEVATLCLDVCHEYPRGVVFAGEIVFDEPRWYDRMLHNETAFSIQRRLRFAGVPIVILPIRLFRNPNAAR